MFIGGTLRESVIDDINSSPYFSVLIDGSTDSSVKEKELMYLLFAKGDGSTAGQFFGMKDVVDASASGINAVLVSVFDNLGVDNWSSKLVVFVLMELLSILVFDVI